MEASKGEGRSATGAAGARAPCAEDLGGRSADGGRRPAVRPWGVLGAPEAGAVAWVGEADGADGEASRGSKTTDEERGRKYIFCGDGSK